MRRRCTSKIIAALAALLFGLVAMAPGAEAHPAQQIKLQAKGSSYCLENLSYSTADGTNAGMWGCYTGDNQVWTLFGNEEVGHYLINKFSGKCLEVLNYSKQEGAPLGQWECYGGDNQFWFLIQGAGYTYFVNKFSGLCLAATHWMNGVVATQRSCNQVNAAWLWWPV
jgi:hypothetical protein